MLRRFLILLGLIVAAVSAPAAAASPDAQIAWRLLDYLAVDYAGAVDGGKVVSASEYAEMREFSASVGERIAALPATPAKARLAARSATLQALIARKASPPSPGMRSTRPRLTAFAISASTTGSASKRCTRGRSGAIRLRSGSAG
jgi:hypothetical protein